MAPLAYLRKEKAQFDSATYKILRSIPDQLMAPKNMLVAARMARGYPGFKLLPMFYFVFQSFTGRTKLEKEGKQKL